MKSPCLLLRASLSISLLFSASVYSAGLDSASPSSPSDTSTSAKAPEVPQPAPASAASVAIPGPLRSFLRMAGISQKISTEEVLPLLARNVAVEGYQGRKDRTGRPTEFLILLKRYVEQARQLVTLAGPEGTIRVANCDQAGPLLDILGYRLRQGCGKSAALETADPERAFLTIDSGFPLAELEQTLQGGKPFVYPFAVSPVPLLFSAEDWTQPGTGAKGNDVLDAMLDDPMLARLYWAMSRMDTETSAELAAICGNIKAASFRLRSRFLQQSHLHSKWTHGGARRSGCGTCVEGTCRRESGFAERIRGASAGARMTAGWPLISTRSRA